MSETHTTHQHSETPQVEASPVQTANGLYYEVFPFRKGGNAEAFSYTAKQYKTVNDAVADLGDEAVADMINAEVAARIGIKARNIRGFGDLSNPNKVPAHQQTQFKAQLIANLTAKYPSMIIFGEAEAKEWKPGVRELTIGGIQKKINEAFKKLGEAKTVEARNQATSEFNNWIAQLTLAAQRSAERSEVV